MRVHPKFKTDSAATIVDSVLAICQAMDQDDWSIADLGGLFSLALEGGLECAAIKFFMIHKALADAAKKA